jgi:sugar phosphate isomerase/epimerase
MVSAADIIILMMYTRRDIARLAVAAPLSAAFAKKMIDSKFNGVMVGAQSYSFRDRSLDVAIAAMKDIGIGYVELWQGHVEPKDRSEIKKWRTDPPLDQLAAIRKQLDDAGIDLYAFNYSFRDDFTDAEIESGFKMAKAMSVNKITASSNVSTSPRIDPYAQKYKIYVGMHNHDSMKPNEFSTPDDFAKAMAGRSQYIKINLDIGHFTAANFDPVAFLEEHHKDILTLHIKDRKKNHGDNMPFGQGETNIKGVLDVLKTKHYPIPAMIEYEYGKPGMDTVAEVRKSFEYIKQALA